MIYLNVDGRLSDLEEFQRDEEQLRFKMATMEKQLVSQEEEHQAALHRLEIDVLMEKERLDPRLINSVKCVVEDF